MLRYTDIEEAIRLALFQGMSTIRIVRSLTGSSPHSEALKIAQKAALILNLSVKAFMELRPNRSGVQSAFSRSIMAALNPSRAS